MFTDVDKRYLLGLKQQDITRELIENLLVSHYDRATRKIIKPRLNWDDEFSLKKGEYFNTEDIKRTNVGLFLFNKFVIEDLLEHVLGYWNIPISDNVLGDMEDKINKALFEDKIKPEDFAEYEDRLQWVLALHTMVAGSFTRNTIRPLPQIVKKRDKLFAENKEALENGDAVTALKIEDELIKDAKELLKGDPGLDLYNSGARGSFGNNYKNIAIMKGPIFDPISGKYKNVRTNFSEGITKEDIPEFASMVVMGAYPKAVGTQVGGYTVKRFYAAFQNITMDEKGTDCHSKGTLTITVNKDNKEDCMFRYIMEGKKVVRLDESNIGKYMGKTVQLRSPMFCTQTQLCNTCFGDKPYMVGIKNVGLTAGKIGSNFVNLSMKSFHDTTMKLEEIKPEDILL